MTIYFGSLFFKQRVKKIKSKLMEVYYLYLTPVFCLLLSPQKILYKRYFLILLIINNKYSLI